jgi:hypothetical protein
MNFKYTLTNKLIAFGLNEFNELEEIHTKLWDWLIIEDNFITTYNGISRINLIDVIYKILD